MAHFLTFRSFSKEEVTMTVEGMVLIPYSDQYRQIDTGYSVTCFNHNAIFCQLLLTAGLMIRYLCICEVHMSPALNEGPAIQALNAGVQ